MPYIYKTRPTVEERFWKKVKKTKTCWLWTASHSEYGHFWTGSRMAVAHRFSWEIHRGPIPENLQLDHLCQVKMCVNPDHLEPVTASENQRRAKLVNKKNPKPYYVGWAPKKLDYSLTLFRSWR